MLQVAERAQRQLDDAMAGTTLQIHDESDTARVVFELRAVQTLRRWQIGRDWHRVSSHDARGGLSLPARQGSGKHLVSGPSGRRRRRPIPCAFLTGNIILPRPPSATKIGGGPHRALEAIDPRALTALQQVPQDHRGSEEDGGDLEAPDQHERGEHQPGGTGEDREVGGGTGLPQCRAHVGHGADHA